MSKETTTEKKLPTIRSKSSRVTFLRILVEMSADARERGETTLKPKDIKEACDSKGIRCVVGRGANADDPMSGNAIEVVKQTHLDNLIEEFEKQGTSTEQIILYKDVFAQRFLPIDSARPAGRTPEEQYNSIFGLVVR